MAIEKGEEANQYFLHGIIMRFEKGGDGEDDGEHILAIVLGLVGACFVLSAVASLYICKKHQWCCFGHKHASQVHPFVYSVSKQRVPTVTPQPAMSVNSSKTIYSLPTAAGQTVNCLSGDQQRQMPVGKPEKSSGDTLPMTNLVMAMTSRYGNVDYQDSEVPRVGTQSHREHKKCDEQLRHQNPKENKSIDAFPLSCMVKAMTGRYENVEDREKDDWDDNLEDDIFSETSANQCEDSSINSVSNNGRKAQLVYSFDPNQCQDAGCSGLLKVTEGEIVFVLQSDMGSGWTYVFCQEQEKSGFVPTTALKILT